MPTTPRESMKDVVEAAAYLGIAPDTLRGWRRLGRIAFYKIGSRVLFSQADLDAYLAGCRVPARQDELVTAGEPSG